MQQLIATRTGRGAVSDNMRRTPLKEGRMSDDVSQAVVSTVVTVAT
ncbi:MAG TPA: hypothetical protein VGC04_14390 [Cellulomonas sp.]